MAAMLVHGVTTSLPVLQLVPDTDPSFIDLIVLKVIALIEVFWPAFSLERSCRKTKT